MKIGIIMGSIRDGRANEDVAKWVKDIAENYTNNAEFEIVDLKTIHYHYLMKQLHLRTRRI